ncbi:HIT family protein [Demetria terragena]|uniref:HIT family protein n=1 Tax=Demetria terragena TaxID=63959 RepID=UPI0004756852|nr:HIT family protein [Demetria terragena]
MATLFTKIIEGEIPGHFVWQDDRCVAFLVIDPITDGHTIVVPRQEVDQWLDADPDLLHHLTSVAQHIGLAQRAAFEAPRVSLLTAGFEVPHLHLHVFPITGEADISFAQATRGQDQTLLAEQADRLRCALRDLGHGEAVPAS